MATKGRHRRSGQGRLDRHALVRLERYANDALGEISVSQAHGATTFDFGEWKSEMATRKNPDGTISFITTAPGISGFFEFVVGAGTKRTLIVRDAQHEYVFTEQGPRALAGAASDPSADPVDRGGIPGHNDRIDQYEVGRDH